MPRSLTYWLIAILLFSQSLQAQKKYALVIGINDYYDAPGKLYEKSLKGCVNDALSIKELLINRFGYDAADITTLFNGEATKRNLLEKIRLILGKVKPGDAFVFYYSGHGVWMSNDHNRSDKIKKGMSQAIVMSDLYSPNWNCLVRDETLKGIFNKFLDKKVITTTILDCCYSANLMMLARFDLFPMESSTMARKKDFDINDLPYFPEKKEPQPCKGDSTDLVDTDGDGVIDCADWEPHSPSRYVDEKGVSIEFSVEDFYIKPDQLVDSFGLGESADEKAFDISKTVKDTVLSLQARPVDRKGGGFVSMAATSEYEKGLEIVDLAGSRHGAFTMALVYYFNEHPATTPLAEVLKGITAIMDKQQYRQEPTFYYEGSRENKNLVGIADGNEKPTLELSCIGINNGLFILNMGRHAGVYPGNRFQVKGRQARSIVEVISVTGDSAMAKKINGVIVKGDKLEMTDARVATQPRLKVFIPSIPISRTAYDQFMKKKIIPLSKEANIKGPLNDEQVFVKGLRFYLNTEKIRSSSPYQYVVNNDFMVFLPFPSYLAEGLKKIVEKDQNIEILKDSAGADMMLFMSYQPETKTEKAGLVIGFNTPMLAQPDYERSLFQPLYIKLNDLNLKPAEQELFYKNMESLIWRYLRKKTTAWLNQWPRKPLASGH